MNRSPYIAAALAFALSLPLASCRNKTVKGRTEDNGAFAKAKANPNEPNVSKIASSGELIIATISGPDTYFDYQGRGMGLQYALAEDFARTLGVSVRVELAGDSTELVKKLQSGDVDLIAYRLPKAFVKRKGLTAAGAHDKEGTLTWAVAANAADLAEALDEWFGEGVELKAQRTEKDWLRHRTVVRRKVRAPFISREKGIISTYDNLFHEAARSTGWDWRLIAAQCYQESGFDPNAVSWAGACGLMQIMPGTAAQFNLPKERAFIPTDNVQAAARIIRHLQQQFSGIANAEERVKFVLAAYNGGLGHVRDAQALARKNGQSDQKWEHVGYYVRNLSNARYYRDPVVRHGYMIGSETYNYVESIMQRWQQYGGSPAQLRLGGNISATAAAVRSDNGTQTVPHRRNRYSKEHKILTPEEIERQ